MNIASLKNLVNNNKSLWITGILLGAYVNILHTIPFMLPSEFFLIFLLIALFAITIPAVAVAWNQKEINTFDKLRHIIKGMSVSSTVFIFIYLAETIITNNALRNLNSPAQFSISRAPITSLLVALILTAVLFLSLILYRFKTSTTGSY
jgi:hypothetical protein